MYVHNSRKGKKKKKKKCNLFLIFKFFLISLHIPMCTVTYLGTYLPCCSVLLLCKGQNGYRYSINVRNSGAVEGEECV